MPSRLPPADRAWIIEQFRRAAVLRTAAEATGDRDEELLAHGEFHILVRLLHHFGDDHSTVHAITKEFFAPPPVVDTGHHDNCSPHG